jgi:hypothetical protein
MPVGVAAHNPFPIFYPHHRLKNNPNHRPAVGRLRSGDQDRGQLIELFLISIFLSLLSAPLFDSIPMHIKSTINKLFCNFLTYGFRRAAKKYEMTVI